MLVALSATALAGCGGGGTDTVAQAPSTAAQFQKQLNAVCREHIKKQTIASTKFANEDGRYRETGKPVTHRELEEQLLQVIIPNVEETIPKLEALHPPPAQEALLNELLKDLKRGVKASEADQSWIIHDIPEPFKPARKVGTRLGNMTCGEP